MVICKKWMVIIAAGIIIAGMLGVNSSTSYAAEKEICVMPMQTEYHDALEEEGEIPADGEYVISEEVSSLEEPMARTISSMTISFARKSSTSAEAQVKAIGTTSVKSMKSTIVLQKKNQSTGKYVTVSGSTRTKTISGRSIQHTVNYSIQSGQSYRVKCSVYDGTSTITDYEKL